MEITFTVIILALIAAIFVGIAKTGVPGVGILPVVIMATAFSTNAKLSVGAILPILILGDITAVLYYKRHAQWRRLIRLVPYVALGMIPGVMLLNVIEGNDLRPILGGLILFLLGLDVGRRIYLSRRNGNENGDDNESQEPKPAFQSIWLVGAIGALAGFCTMIGNAAGPLLSVYFVGMGLKKEEFVGTAAWFFLTVNMIKVPVYCYLGMITLETLKLDAMVAIGVLFGGVIGIWLLSRIPQKLFNILVLSLAAIAALHMLIG